MKGVLITRPLPAGRRLCEQLNVQGISTILFPTVIIEPVVCDKFTSADWVIFTSPNAVYHGKTLIPSKIRVAAIGEGTAQALRDAGITVSLVPKNFSSEGLLALSEFHVVDHPIIALIKGMGGKTLLRKTLEARGVIVNEYNVYRRCLPTYTLTEELLDSVDIVLVTSREILLNLITLTPLPLKSALFNKHWVVTNVGLISFAKEQGVRGAIENIADARDRTILEKLNELR